MTIAPLPLANRLLTPLETIPLSELPSRWFHQHIHVTVAGAAAVADDLALTGRIRGAWGQELMRSASPEALADQPCPWDPPCALDALFREQGRLTSRLALPRPYVISARRAEGRDALIIRLSLFGFATDWSDGAAEALTAALRYGDPLRLGRPGTAVQLPPLHRTIRTLDACLVPADPGLVTLDFRTPVAFRSAGGAQRPNARTLIASLGNRVSGLARWLDCAPEADWRGLAEHAETVSCEADTMVPAVWHRRSRRQDGRLIPVTGWYGSLTLQGQLEPLLPLLVLGQTCHAGSHSAHGLGCYDLGWPT